MNKRRLRPFVMPMIYGMACAAIVMSLVLLDKNQNDKIAKETSDYVYVNSTILTNEVPVNTTTDTSILKPFTSDKVQVSKKYYDTDSTDAEKQNAIIFYNNTYMQNSGILYKADESFDIISILDGTVVNVKKDEVLGNIVEVKHSNNLISTYEGLSEVSVKKDQTLKQGDVIGKSGKIDVGEVIDNGLLFELIYDGKIVNPDKYFDKKVNEL